MCHAILQKQHPADDARGHASSPPPTDKWAAPTADSLIGYMHNVAEAGQHPPVKD